MGADVIGWRECSLQKELQADGFLHKLKLRAYKSAIEKQIPEERLDVATVTISINGEPRDSSYSEIVSDLGDFSEGISECDACPLSEGERLGCYKYVTYPVDTVFEELVFEFFTSQLPVRDSISEQLYRDLVSQCPTDTSFHTGRPALAEREEPLVFSFGGMFRKRVVDSAQLLSCLFLNLEEPAMLVAMARFWLEFEEFVDQRFVAAMAEQGVELAEDGSIHMMVAAEEPDNVAEDLESRLAELSWYDSNTISEVRDVGDMLKTIALRYDEGWTAIVDG